MKVDLVHNGFPELIDREPFGPLRRGVSRNSSANQELGRLRMEPSLHQAALARDVLRMQNTRCPTHIPRRDVAWARSMICLSGQIMYGHKDTLKL